FFTSRKRHTLFSRDWSSDVCSSDLAFLAAVAFDLAAIDQDLFGVAATDPDPLVGRDGGDLFSGQGTGESRHSAGDRLARVAVGADRKSVRVGHTCRVRTERSI